jgi:hypothetical protein
VEPGEHERPEVNPYQSPSGEVADDPIAAEILDELGPGEYSAWRDGDILVVRLDRQPVLPTICIKSGRVDARFRVPRERILGIPDEQLIAHSKWPISRAWEDDIPITQMLGLFLTVFAIPLLFIFVSLATDRLPSWMGAILSLVPIGSFVVGVAMLVMSYRVFLQAVAIKYPFAWLEGAHPRFLSKLRDWPFDTANNRESRPRESMT